MNIEYTLEITKNTPVNAQSFFSLELTSELTGVVIFLEDADLLRVLTPTNTSPILEFAALSCQYNAKNYVAAQLAQTPNVTCEGYGANVSCFHLEQADGFMRRIARPMYDEWLFSRFSSNGKGVAHTQATHKIIVEAYVKATLDGKPYVLV